MVSIDEQNLLLLWDRHNGVIKFNAFTKAFTSKLDFNSSFEGIWTMFLLKTNIHAPSFWTTYLNFILNLYEPIEVSTKSNFFLLKS